MSRKPKGFFTKGKGKTRKVIPIMGSTGKRRSKPYKVTARKASSRKTHPHLKYDKKYDYWPVPRKLVKSKDSLEWGFDLSSVRSASTWSAFLKKHDFKKVDEAPRTHTGPAIYKNPDGIYVVTEHSEHGRQKRGEGGFLGYMRFEAPKSQNRQLQAILRDFRGPRQLTFVNSTGHKWDYQARDMEGGIATYVKEESPNDAAFI